MFGLIIKGIYKVTRQIDFFCILDITLIPVKARDTDKGLMVRNDFCDEKEFTRLQKVMIVCGLCR